MPNGQSPDNTPWAEAARATYNFCSSQGYSGGIPSGHWDGNSGVWQTICFNIDYSTPSAANLGTSFNESNWQLMGRAANDYCLNRGYDGGRGNGHHIANDKIGIMCFGSGSFDPPLNQLN